MPKLDIREIDELRYDFYAFVSDAKKDVEIITGFGISLQDDSDFFSEFWDSLSDDEFMIEPPDEKLLKLAVHVHWMSLVRRFSLKFVEDLGLKQHSVTIQRVREVETATISVWATDKISALGVASNNVEKLSDRQKRWNIELPQNQEAKVVDVQELNFPIPEG